jgi:uncharacterized membrane protein
MKSIKIKYLIYALLILLIALTGYLSYVDSIGSTEGVCLLGGDSPSVDCNDVQNSKYGSFLGVKVCHWGLLAFLILLVLYIISNTKTKYKTHSHELFVLFAFIGSLISLYFLYTQFFILKTLCSTCLIIDIVTIAVFILGYLESHKIRKNS